MYRRTTLALSLALATLFVPGLAHASEIGLTTLDIQTSLAGIERERDIPLP